MSATAVRAALRGYMWKTVQYQRAHSNWVYDEVRPLPIAHLLPSVPATIRSDCSFGCKLLCHAAGAPDPTGMGYDGYGNSVSIFEHLPPAVPRLPGDIVVWGPDVHAAMIYSVGRDSYDTWLWNMGSQGEPVFRTLAQEIAGHPGIGYWARETVRPDPAATIAGNPPAAARGIR